MTSVKLVFAGSPPAAVPSLRALAASRHDVAAVFTRTDTPQGRRGTLTPTAVAEEARSLGIGTVKANRLAREATEAVADLQPDLGVIVAYGGLVREPLLSMPRLGWINLHFSLLPRWRGAAPVQRAIIAGDEITGASVFQLVDELDAGDVYGQLTEPIGALQTAGSLLDSLAASGAELLLRVVDGLADGSVHARPQVGDVTLAPKLTLDDGRIDWTADGNTVHARIRGVTPEPGAFTTIDGTRVKVLDAVLARDIPPLPPGKLAMEGRSLVIGTGSVPVELLSVHPSGKKAMAAPDWWRGRPSDAGTVAE